jgi:2-oxo-3-hexenedioate decarboxylase
MLNDARLSSQPIEQLSKSYKLDSQMAYAIQTSGIEFRRQHKEKVIGLKMGLTSEAKRRQMNLDSPLYGVLTDKMQVKNASVFSLSQTKGIHPKIEPEIAFVTNKDLKGIITIDHALAACSGVTSALEILDSRYREFKYFSLEDVIADNSSSFYFLIGETLVSPQSLPLDNLEMNLLVNGKLTHTGSSSAISGHPAQSIVDLCRLLAESDSFIPAGSIVLAGAATPAVALEPEMKIELLINGLPSLKLTIGN